MHWRMGTCVLGSLTSGWRFSPERSGVWPQNFRDVTSDPACDGPADCPSPHSLITSVDDPLFQTALTGVVCWPRSVRCDSGRTYTCDIESGGAVISLLTLRP